MKFTADKIIVFDLETTCWEGKGNHYKYREVIALGACILDVKSLEIIGDCNLVCKPTKTEISEYCTSITGITQELADEGIDFEEMCKQVIQKYDSKNLPCAAWGNDGEKMYSECRQKECKHPFSNQYLNISLLYSVMMGKPHNNGLERSLAELGMKFIGEKHNPYRSEEHTSELQSH